jgi:hypothetical protein
MGPPARSSRTTAPGSTVATQVRSEDRASSLPTSCATAALDKPSDQLRRRR